MLFIFRFREVIYYLVQISPHKPPIGLLLFLAWPSCLQGVETCVQPHETGWFVSFLCSLLVFLWWRKVISCRDLCTPCDFYFLLLRGRTVIEGVQSSTRRSWFPVVELFGVAKMGASAASVPHCILILFLSAVFNRLPWIVLWFYLCLFIMYHTCILAWQSMNDNDLCVTCVN